MSILVNTGFKVGGAEPLNEYSVRETLDDRDALVTDGFAYEGMKVYCKDTKLEYRYTGTYWEIVDSGIGSGGDLTDYQKKTDNTLTTTDKTIVGAINEVKDSIITNYEDLTNKPSIEGVELDGNKSLSDLGIYDDTEIRLNKTWSSSKIYTDIQNAIDTSKAYTLAELGKASGASYKVVSSTGDMTEQKYIYLMSDGASSYNMYIVEDDGTATQIGDTTINLDNYFTKTEITDNYYDKATSDGKFATITTIDTHKDDTDIHITSAERTKWNNATNEEKVKEIVDSEMTTKGVCTTSVEDVADVNVISSLNTLLAIANSIAYTVKNGICYIRITGLCPKFECDKTVILPNGTLPKPSVALCYANISSWDGTNTSTILLLPTSTGSLELWCNINSVNRSHYGSFSYPVSES